MDAVRPGAGCLLERTVQHTNPTQSAYVCILPVPFIAVCPVIVPFPDRPRHHSPQHQSFTFSFSFSEIFFLKKARL